MDAADAQPAAAIAQPQVCSRISIAQPLPFFPHPGDPSLPWHMWFMVFETYLLLLEEEHGMHAPEQPHEKFLAFWFVGH